MGTTSNASVLIRMRGKAWHTAIASTVFLATAWTFLSPAAAQVAVRGKTVYTMAGRPIQDGVVVVKDGKIVALGEAAEIKIPDGVRVLDLELAIDLGEGFGQGRSNPGLIKAQLAAVAFLHAQASQFLGIVGRVCLTVSGGG